MIKNIKTPKIHKISKLAIICIILTLFSYVFLNYIGIHEVLAGTVTQVREPYSNRIDNYPHYKELIDKLKEAHPNWNFKIFYTGLDWYQVIKNETTAYHGRNVVPSNRTSAWKCSVCGETPRGGSSWRCASEAAVSYYMDPRNWINDTYIFQFENLSYNGDVQTLEGVKKIIENIGYMQGDTITYTKTDGTTGTIEKSYAQVIYEAAQDAKISPYHLASRIRQEQGGGNSPGWTATGTFNGYTGYYNFLNIKASGSNDTQVTVNGLEHAKKQGWTDPEISIKEGTKVLASNYINDGQDTLYLQKFDVDNSDGTLYYFQYMQNVSACITESAKPREVYQELGIFDSAFEFIIPVYENMPETICAEPVDGAIVTQNVKVKGTNVNIRSGATVSSSIIATVNTGYDLLRIELASVKNGDYYWDKVVLPDGRKGYIARNYIEQVEDITNCNDIMISNTSVNLRNGPGLTGTSIITMLIKGQILTRIETGKYNLDGYIWDRVKLADGRQGYIAQNYIEPNTGNKDEGDSSKTEIIKVICPSGLKVREQPGTDQRVLTYLNKGNILTRTQAEVENKNGYIWDKIVTADGIEGYIARGDSQGPYIEVVTTNVETNTPPAEQKNDNFKLEDDNLVCEPETTVESIKEKYTDTEITIKNAEGTEITTGEVGTGYTITIDNKSYNIIKLGDVNGDGEINSGDSLILVKEILKTMELSNQDSKKAADVNLDGDINAGDSLILVKQILGNYKISVEGKEQVNE